jgi:hypothetical protein
MTRWISVAVLATVVSIGGAMAAQRPRPVVEVYKSPTCGCCALWVKHLQQNGFDAKVTDVEDITQVKTKNNVPARAQSCHTAVVNGYVLEGHVPAADVQRLLKDRPTGVRGLAVPGMPLGSPGMEAGTTVQRFDVLAFDLQGRTTVFASYGR